MRRSVDASIIVAALSAVAMIGIVLMFARRHDNKIEQASSAPRPNLDPPAPPPRRKPRPTYPPTGGDEIAPSSEEKVPPVPMPGVGPVPTDESPPLLGGREINKAAAIESLKSVPYKDCGDGGAGKVTVTFDRNGSVKSAVVTAGEYNAGTKACIQHRFKGAHVPPFDGAPKSFGWSISL